MAKAQIRSHRRLSDRELYLACLPGWAQMYVDGYWTLEKFEQHADAVRRRMFGGE